MHPVLERGVLHPPVGRAAVVGHDVHNDLDSAGVALLHILTVEGVVAQARVDMVVVRAGVAVVRLRRLVVQQKRGVPHCCGAQAGDVVYVLDHPLQVSAVAGHRVGAVHLVGRGGHVPGLRGAVVIYPAGPGGIVVGRAGGEAVRHHEVYHIFRGETAPGGAAFIAPPQQVGEFEAVAAVVEHEPGGAGDSVRTDDHVHEEVIVTVRLADADSLHAGGAFYAHVPAGDVRALHQQLERHFHSRPPAGRLYAHDFFGTGVTDAVGVETLPAGYGEQGDGGRCRGGAADVGAEVLDKHNCRYSLPFQTWME